MTQQTPRTVSCRFPDGYSALETLRLHELALVLGSPAIAAHCRLQIFLKSTAATHGVADFTVRSWIMAADSLHRQGFWVPARFRPQTLANGYMHVSKGDVWRSSLLQQLLASVNLKVGLQAHDNQSYVVEGQGHAEGFSTISTPFAHHSHHDSSAPPQRISYFISSDTTVPDTDHHSEIHDSSAPPQRISYPNPADMGPPNIDHYSEIHAAMAQELVPISCWTDKDLAVLLHAQAELQHRRNKRMVTCSKHTAGECPTARPWWTSKQA
ncbi:hypothetical protein ABBQ38_012219 [Trebouxia sp. C0009 RCD-2024]